MFLISVHDIKFAVTIFESVNPFSYGHLKHRNPVEAASYLFSLILVGVFISAFLFIPTLISLRSGIDRFDTIGLSMELEPTEPFSVNILGIDAVHFGSSESSSILSVGSDGFSSRPLLCSLIQPSCRLFPGSSISAVEMKDLSGRKDDISGLLQNLVVLSLPSIIAIALVVYSLKYFIIAVFLSLAGILFSRIAGLELNLNSSFAISCYSLTVLVIPQMLGYSFGFDLLGIEWLGFAALFISGILLSSKKGGQHGRGRSAEDKHTSEGAA